MAKFKDRKKSSKLNNDKLDAEFKKARQDVFKFGVKHLNKKDKESTKYDQLIRLGAEPKKKRGINYKELMKIKKEEKIVDLKSDDQLKKHLAIELKKQIDMARSKVDKKRFKINKKKKKN